MPTSEATAVVTNSCMTISRKEKKNLDKKKKRKSGTENNEGLLDAHNADFM